MRPIAPSLPGTDDASSHRMVLRDGSVATVRIATTGDVPALRQFFHGLSSASHYQRFMTAGEPSDEVLERLSDSVDPSRGLTFVAERAGGQEDFTWIV